MSAIGPPGNRRVSARNGLVTGRIPGRLIAEERDKPLTAMAVDVSRTGLGIITDRPLSEGTPLWLVLDDRAVRLEVRHCREASDDSGQGLSYRLGLLSTVPWENLEELFLRKGLARPRALEY